MDPCSNNTSEAREASGHDTFVGRIIDGRFRVLSLIAEGGMGRVYEAEQLPVGRIVALKILAFGHGPMGSSSGGSTASQFQQRFFLEASICAKLTHPNTVTLFDYGRTDDGIFFIAMELIRGRPLSRVLAEDGPLEPTRAVSITRQAACSLREAHRLGVIHRDIKPGNILLTQHDDNSDFVKVLDFGLVKPVAEDNNSMTQTGLFLGTPRYMSPEQIRAGQLDARSDIYSLGVLLYEMLSGQAPFMGSSAMDTAAAHLVEEPITLAKRCPELKIPKAISQVVMRCLAKSPEDRYDSVDELLAALADAAKQAHIDLPQWLEPSGEFDSDTVAARPRASRHLKSRLTQHRSVAFAGAGAGAAALLLAGLSFWIDPELVNQMLSSSLRAEPRQMSAQPEATAEPGEPAPEFIIEAEEPVEPARSTVALRSSPAGARVSVKGNTVCPSTPCDVDFPAEEDARNRTLEFRFSRNGYQALTVKRALDGDRVQVAAVLKRNVSNAKTNARSRSSAAAARKKEKKRRAAQDTYKSNPY